MNFKHNIMNNYFWKVAASLAFLFLVGCSGGESVAESSPSAPDQPGKPENPTPALADDTIPAHSFQMGSLTGFEAGVRNGNTSHAGGNSSTTYYNLPLFEVYDFKMTDSQWWDDIVEEFEYSGMDYICPNCRGCLPDPKKYTDHGDPNRIKDLIAAIKRRGSDLKVAIFDDAPASWAAARNLDKYGAYVPVLSDNDLRNKSLTDKDQVYPIDDLNDIYKYIWDYNIKLAFANFYGPNSDNNQYLFRYKGKPLLYIWSPNGFLNVEYRALGNKKPDCNGRLKAILDKLHADFKSTFGEEVFICVDGAFRDRDPQSANSADAFNNWFTASEAATNRSSYTLANFKGHNVGVACPGFLCNDRSGSRMLFDAGEGKRLTKALDYFVKFHATLVLLEGFTDMVENAAFFRSKDTKYYSFPNQRLNLLRKYSSSRAYPLEMNVEAETCDKFVDNTPGNSGNQYRSGDIDIKTCNDGYPGWCVTNTAAGESLEWVELPYRNGSSVIRLRYSSNEEVRVRIDIDGKEGHVTTLPATGGGWKTADAATVTMQVKGWHRTVLNVVSGNIDINKFTIVASK